MAQTHQLVWRSTLVNTCQRPARTTVRVLAVGTRTSLTSEFEHKLAQMVDPRVWVYQKRSYDRHGMCRFERDNGVSYQTLAIERI